ncbi:putative membrane protein [Rosellinia necatrix]|uniref:Delta(14)-sterol reductase n=1 Tax=Rosellinia necatrix TaxID=77044 RepID=A0A1S7UHZ8_ROSNE|nr:putative membrane protein [Rosellinia necatrix]
MPDRKKPFDLIRRGEKKPTLSGTLTFVGLRAADVPLQRALLAPGAAGLGVRLLAALGVRRSIYTHPPALLDTALLLPVRALLPPRWSGSGSGLVPGALTSLPPTALLLVLMSAGAAAKQIYWQLCLSAESFPAPAAAAVGAYNTLLNGAAALLFLAAGTTSLLSRPRISSIPFPIAIPTSASSPGDLPLSVVVGTCLYAAGLAIETVAERQRVAFKRRPGNNNNNNNNNNDDGGGGRAPAVCDEGLWRWARHINYFGYVLWRAGYAMAAGGWVAGVAVGLLQGWDLGRRAVAVQDAYCSARYGERWARFRREVPYRIVPGVY